MVRTVTSSGPASVKAGTYAEYTVSFFNANGDPETPTEIYYRVDNVDAGIEVIADTLVGTPSDSIMVALTAVDNVLRRAGSQRERNRITVRSKYAQDQEYFVHTVDCPIVRVRNPVTAA